MTGDTPMNLDQLAARLQVQTPGIHNQLKDCAVTLTYGELRRICECCATNAANEVLRLDAADYQAEAKHLCGPPGMVSKTLLNKLQCIVTFQLRNAAAWRGNCGDQAQP